METRKKRYTLEYKITAAKLAANSNYSVAKIASDLGVHHNSLYKWVQLYTTNLQDAFPRAEVKTLETDIVKHLNRVNERLALELDLLKNKLSAIQLLTADSHFSGNAAAY